MLDDRTLRYVAAVSQTGSLRAAAKELGVAPSAVQRTLASAERRVGCLLFERGAKGARATQAGLVVIQHAQERDDLSAHLSARLSMVTSAATGEVSIGVGPGFVEQITNYVLTPFMQKHPQIRVNILTGGTSAVTGLLLADRVDVAVALHPTLDEGLNVVETVSQSVGLACGTAHHLSLVERVSPSQLHGERMAVLPEGFGLRALHESFVRAHALKVKIAMESDNQAAIVAAVAAGNVVALLPPVTVARAQSRGEVHLRPVEDHYLNSVRAALITRSGRRLAPAAAALLDACCPWFN